MVKRVKSTKEFSKKHLGSRPKQKQRGRNLPARSTPAERKAVHFEEQEARTAGKASGNRHDRQDRNPPTGNTQQKEHNEQLKSQKEHNEQLKSLRDTDPEFYEFLKDHDEKLLEFGSDVEEDEEEDVNLGLENDEDDGSPKGDGSPLILTASDLDGWFTSLRGDKPNMGALRNVLQAFRTACHFGYGEETEAPTKYSLLSSHVFNKVMMFGLCEMVGVFKKELRLPAGSEAKGWGFSTGDLVKNSRWKKLEPFVKSYLGNSLNVLKQMTDDEMTAFTLRRLREVVPFTGPFPNLSRRFLKVALHYLCSADAVVSVLSLFFIRQMALQFGEETLDDVLKGIYKEYVANARFVNSTTLPQIAFRANCVVELYGIDLRASYQKAFVFIQQMAVVLRKALTMETKTSFKSVCCWQYINCLRVWVKVICKYHQEDELRRLAYPLVQVLHGVLQLVPTLTYFPLRLHCVKMIVELSAISEEYISVAPLLLDMLQFKELYMSPTGGMGNAIDFGTSLKIPKPSLRTQKLQDDCVTAVLEELARHLAQWSYAAAFPELAIIPVQQLRQMMKKLKLERLSRKVKQLVEHIERNIQYVWRNREKESLSLDDRASVSMFLQAEKRMGSSPLSQYVAVISQRADQYRALVDGEGEKKEDKSSIRETGVKFSSKRFQNNVVEDEDDVVDDLVLPGGAADDP